MQVSTFLKRVLILDAASCLGMGVMLIAGAGMLSTAFGLADSLLLGAGALLVPIGLFILWAGTRASVAPFFVYLIVAGNAAWVLESLLLMESSVTISALGTAFVAVQAAAVAGLAILEWIGVRRARLGAAGV